MRAVPGLRDRDLWLLAGGDLDAVEEDCGAAGTDAPGGEGLDGLTDDELGASGVEPGRHLNADLAGTHGTLGAGVKVTEGAAAHGGRLAMETLGIT